MLAVIGFYRRFVSPVKAPCCRFYPTCSEYAGKAVAEHGALRGAFLACRRILKCHPFHPGGYDPVPPKTDSSSSIKGNSK
jgi:putative membrane protein insertion efficiency factor